MSCLDLNLSLGKALDILESSQTESGGDLVAGLLSTNDIYAKTILLTPDISRAGAIIKLVGFDFILDNQSPAAVLPETLDLYIFNSEPLAGAAALVPGAAFSTLDQASYQNIVAYFDLAAMPVSADKSGIITATLNESDISAYIETGDTTTLYAVIVTRSTTASTIAAGATLKTRFKFEGVMS